MNTFIKSVKNWLKKDILTLFFSILAGIVFSQDFGQNKVQYRNFDWKYIQSRHFDVYYYGNNIFLAEFTADVAESSYVSLRQDFRFEIEKRIPIMIYAGHNDFEQTNATYSMIEETVGGFTEVFKDRVVIPFTGSWEEFRHVIHHELTHAVMFQVYYGGGVGSVIAGMARFQLPLWLAEGLAEYESLGWDNGSDMYMRDATMNGYVPSIEQMGGFMVYKGGQSLLNDIANKYGRLKIGELLGKIRVNRNVDEGFKQAIGVDLEELSKRWNMDLRKTYWPDIQDRMAPEDIAKRFTNHSKKRNFFNSAPALSPKGDKLVYLSDQSDYTDIYLMSTVDGKNLGKLIQGERSDLFEELHWVRPGMSWSPDGKQIIFSTKAGAVDVLHILNVEKHETVSTFRLRLDGVFSPSWSPDGENVAFMGIQDGRSDIYIFRIADQQLRKLTDDVFSDMDPSWSPNGQEIVFISDRGDYIEPPSKDLRIQEHNYHQQDLYAIQVETGKITRYTSDQANEHNPVFSPDGNQIAYISDNSGIDNIYIQNRTSGTVYPITNLLTGVSHFSWSREGSRLAFSSFYDGGYDVYLLNNPLEIKPGAIQLKKTALIVSKETQTNRALEEQEKGPEKQTAQNFQSFVFDTKFLHGKTEPPIKRRMEFLDTTQYKNEAGEYKTHPYRLRFSPDVVTGDAGYSQFWGLQGSSMIILSDILGNHQIDLYTDLFYNIQNSNFQLAYFYLPKRNDYGISIFHYSYRFYTGYGGYFYDEFVLDREYGLSLYLSRPLDKYRRADFSVNGLGVDRDLYLMDFYGRQYKLGSVYKRRVLLFGLGYTTDKVIWGMTGPMNGERTNYMINYSPSVGNKYGLDFWTVRGDIRKYLRIQKDYALAIRLAGGVSGGKQPQRFLLGGMLNWLNYKYSEITDQFSWDDVFFFSSFETPLRGTYYYNMIGTRFVLANIELRFPLIHYLIVGFPMPVGFQNIRGALFLDMGSAWNNDKSWKPFETSGSGLPKLNDMRAGYGFGIRLNLGFFLLRYDLAWATDFVSTKKTPVNYFSLGADF